MTLTAAELDKHWEWQFVLWAEYLMNRGVQELTDNWVYPQPVPSCAGCWYSTGTMATGDRP